MVEQKAGAPPDVLELGLSLTACRPALEQRLRALTGDAQRARDLTHKALKQAWARRDHAPEKANLEAWLSQILRAEVLN